MKVATNVTILLLVESALACSVPPSGMLEDYHSLIDNTPLIVLAVAVSTGEKKNGFQPDVTFKVSRVLKGEVTGPIHLPGYIVDDPSTPPNDFDSHRDPGFWEFAHGNSIAPGDCQTYGIYHFGETYLLFIRDQGHTKSFENIRSSDDLWLNVVGQIVSGQDRPRE